MKISKILYLFLIMSLCVLLISGCGSTTESDETETAQDSTGQEQQGGDIPHVLGGQDDCIGCHNTDTDPPIPADHQGRTNNECTDCHEQVSNPSAMTASVIPHSLEDRENCLGCHAEGTDSGVPADHAGRTSNVCTVCHQPE